MRYWTSARNCNRCNRQYSIGFIGFSIYFPCSRSPISCPVTQVTTPTPVLIELLEMVYDVRVSRVLGGSRGVEVAAPCADGRHYICTRGA